MGWWLKLALVAFIGVYLVGSFAVVQYYVPEPYMDEVFHVGQTRTYLNGDWGVWDPKITTPPGLYLLGVLAALINPSVAAMRSVNLAGLLVGALVAPKRLRLVLLTVPLLQFYANLYYTDVWASLLVVLGIVWAGSGPEKSVIGALVLLVSLAFRQTNIIWAAYAAWAAFIEPSWSQLGLFRGSLDAIRRYWWQLVPYLAVGAAFCAFVVFNEGSIVLGDKDNHAMALHWAQWLYFSLFFSFLSAPLLLREPYFVKNYVKLWWRRPWLPLIEMLGIALVVHYGTVVHPFILADNRHYTFYLWRRVLHPTWTGIPGSWLLTVPIYEVALRWFAWNLRKLSKYQIIGYIGAVSLVLVPSPLLEPRYYIVPYLVWRATLKGTKPTIPELAWNLAIGALTTGVFCLSSTHFMW